MSMLPRLRPKNFYDLVIEVAIIRPGPIQGGMIHPFLRRRDGLEPVTYADPSLVPILERTLGIPIFQEQVMRVAMAVGDFSPGEADELRRHMGAWQIKGDLGPWIERLVERMRFKGISEEFVQQLVGQFRGFADYGFPESHAASFALLAYVSSYLKCHYPAAFCTALLNSQPMGFYSPNALIQDIRRRGVEVLPVCVESSEWQAKLELIPGAEGDYGIRLGLEMVRGLRRSAAERMLELREQRLGWKGLEDFLLYSDLARPDLTSLAAARAMEVFGIDRRGALWLAEAAKFSPYLEDRDLQHRFVEESKLERVQQDFKSMGTALGEHPSAMIRKECWCYPLAQDKVSLAASLQAQTSGKLVRVFGMVLVRQAPPSAKGMRFFTLEDETGYLNLVFTPVVFEKVREMVNGQGFLCVEGKLQRQNEGHSILVRRVYSPSVKRADVIPISSAHGAAVISEPPKLYKGRNYI